MSDAWAGQWIDSAHTQRSCRMRCRRLQMNACRGPHPSTCRRSSQEDPDRARRCGLSSTRRHIGIIPHPSTLGRPYSTSRLSQHRRQTLRRPCPPSLFKVTTSMISPASTAWTRKPVKSADPSWTFSGQVGPSDSPRRVSPRVCVACIADI